MSCASNIREETSQNEDLKNWLLNLIDAFRKLKNQPKSQHIAIDLSYKCQIEVFWLDYPEAQFIAFTHDDERDDKEIRINGPYSFAQLIDVINDTMQTPRWRKLLPRKNAKSTEKKCHNLWRGIQTSIS